MKGAEVHAYLWDIARTVNYRAAAYARNFHLTWREESAWVTYLWGRLTRAYAKKFGERLGYVSTTEYTEQGPPHIHAVAPERFVEKERARWVKEQWCKLVPGALDIAQDITLRDMPHRGSYRVSGLHTAIHYVLKYIAKGWSNVYEVDGMRRYRQNLGVVRLGPATAFRYVKSDGLLDDFDRIAYDRAYARARYWKLTIQGKETPSTLMPKEHQQYKGALDELQELKRQMDARPEAAEFLMWDELKDHDRAFAPIDAPPLWVLYDNGDKEPV